MERFIRHIASFSLGFVIFGALLMVPGFFSDLWESRFFGSPQSGGAVGLRIPEFDQFVAQHDQIDYLFLGSSTCYRGIDPHQLWDDSLIAFNLGSSSQQIMNARWLVEMTLSEAQVKTVVLDIFPELWGLDGVEPARDHLRNNPLGHRSTFLKMALNTGDPYSLYLYCYFTLKRELEPFEPMRGTNDDYRGLGFVYSKRQVPDSIPCRPGEKHLKMRWKDRQALRTLIEQVEEQNGDVVLLIPPVKCLDPFEIPDEFRSLPLIDARDCPLNDSLWYDKDHLIGEGALIYSRWLSDQLKALQ